MKSTTKTSSKIIEKTLLTEATNLRRDLTTPSVWRCAGTPNQLTTTQIIPIARFSPFGDGRELQLLIDEANKLYFNVIATNNNTSSSDFGDISLLASLPAKPILVVTSTQGIIRLLLNHQPDQYLTYDNSLIPSFHGEMPSLPDIPIVATEYHSFYATVPSIKLSGNSSGESGSQLTKSDSSLLSDALSSTYKSLCQQARSTGYCVQPAMARYRLIDVAGNTVGVGPLVQVSIPIGVSATGSVQLTSTDGMLTLNEGKMDVTAYRPAVIAPAKLPSPWNKIVSKLVVEITAEMEPLDTSQEAGHGIRCDNTTGTVTVTAKLPGFSIGTVVNSSRFRYLGLQLLTSQLYQAAEFSEPFNGGIADAGVVRSFTATGTLPTADNIGTIRLTHSRNYSAALTTGNFTILCNPQVAAFDGWQPDCFIATRTTDTRDEWEMGISVKLSTPAGEQWVRRLTSGVGKVPTTLNPILSYPSTDATEMVVCYLAPDGTAYESTFQLTPLQEAGIAYYANSGLSLITLNESVPVYHPMGDTAPAELRNGMAEIYRSSDLGAALDSMQVADTEIYRVETAPRGSTGWEFSRQKVLFFGEGGIQLTTISASGSFNSVTTVDNRRISSAQAVCHATGSNGSTLIAYADDDLIEVAGQKVSLLTASLSHRLKQPLCGVSLGYNNHFHELWISAENMPLYRITTDGELIKVNIPELNVDGTTAFTTPCRFATHKGDLLLASDAGLFNLSDEDSSTPIAVTLRNRYQAAGRPEWLTLNLFGSEIKGTFQLKGDRGTEIPEELLRLTINGAVNSPIKLRLATPYRQRLEGVYTLTATGDMALLDEQFC
jgi:hypothetical protein